LNEGEKITVAMIMMDRMMIIRDKWVHVLTAWRVKVTIARELARYELVYKGQRRKKTEAYIGG
jgi:hypothetical protein